MGKSPGSSVWLVYIVCLSHTQTRWFQFEHAKKWTLKNDSASYSAVYIEPSVCVFALEKKDYLLMLFIVHTEEIYCSNDIDYLRNQLGLGF